jgi:hypothetical protein
MTYAFKAGSMMVMTLPRSKIPVTSTLVRAPAAEPEEQALNWEDVRPSGKGWIRPGQGVFMKLAATSRRRACR